MMRTAATIHRLALQFERAQTTFRHLAVMTREAQIVAEFRRGELRRAEAVVAAKESKTAKLRQRSNTSEI